MRNPPGGGRGVAHTSRATFNVPRATGEACSCISVAYTMIPCRHLVPGAWCLVPGRCGALSTGAVYFKSIRTVIDEIPGRNEAFPITHDSQPPNASRNGAKPPRAVQPVPTDLAARNSRLATRSRTTVHRRPSCMTEPRRHAATPPIPGRRNPICHARRTQMWDVLVGFA